MRKKKSYNKLRFAKPILRLWESTSFMKRYHEVLICNLRVCHSCITHKYLHRGEDPAQSAHSDDVSILHIRGICFGLEEKLRYHFPEFFRYRIPFHPVILLGDRTPISFDRVLSLISSTAL